MVKIVRAVCFYESFTQPIRPKTRIHLGTKQVTVYMAVSHFEDCTLQRSHLSVAYVIGGVSFQKCNHFKNGKMTYAAKKFGGHSLRNESYEWITELITQLIHLILYLQCIKRALVTDYNPGLFFFFFWKLQTSKRDERQYCSACVFLSFSCL